MKRDWNDIAARLDKALDAIPAWSLADAYRRGEIKDALPVHDDTARFFADGGYLGRKHCPETCLIANYLRQEVVGVQGLDVQVGATSLYLYDHESQDGFSDQWSLKRHIPGLLGDFITAFDRGYYPQLVTDEDPLNPWS